MSIVGIIFLFLVFIVFLVVFFISYRPFVGLGIKPFLKCYYSIGTNLIRKRPNFWSIINYIKRYYTEKKFLLVVRKKAQKDQHKKNIFATKIINELTKNKFNLQKLYKDGYNFNLQGSFHYFESNLKKKVWINKEANFYNMPIGDDFFTRNIDKAIFSSYNFLFCDFTKIKNLLTSNTPSLFFNYIDYVLVKSSNNYNHDLSGKLSSLGFIELSVQNNFVFYIKEKSIITDVIGLQGEFGNQVMQYMTVKVLSINTNRRLQSIPWIGQNIFNNSVSIPEKSLVRNDIKDEYKFLVDKPEKIIDKQYVGAFNFHTKYLANEKELLKSIFSFKTKYNDKFDEKIEALRSEGRTIIGLQLRISGIDTNNDIYSPPPIKVYQEWLSKNWDRYQNPVLFIASDVIEEAVKHFKIYNLITVKSLGMKDSIQYLPDYYLLTKVDILVASFSTFSFTAAMLNDNCSEFYRPNKDKNSLVAFDPWNSYPHPLTVFK